MNRVLFCFFVSYCEYRTVFTIGRCYKSTQIMDTKPIITRRGEVKEIARLMGTSPRTVYSALRGHTRSPLAMRIRQCALNHGGQVVSTAVPHGQWLTEFDERRRQMVCRFWNGYVAHVSMDTSVLMVFGPKGSVDARRNVSHSELLELFSDLARRPDTAG